MVSDVDRSEFRSSYTTGKFETTFRSGERAWEGKRIHSSALVPCREVVSISGRFALKLRRDYIHLGDIESVLYSSVLYLAVSFIEVFVYSEDPLSEATLYCTSQCSLSGLKTFHCICMHPCVRCKKLRCQKLRCGIWFGFVFFMLAQRSRTSFGAGQRGDQTA